MAKLDEGMVRGQGLPVGVKTPIANGVVMQSYPDPKKAAIETLAFLGETAVEAIPQVLAGRMIGNASTLQDVTVPRNNKTKDGDGNAVLTQVRPEDLETLSEIKLAREQGNISWTEARARVINLIQEGGGGYSGYERHLRRAAAEYFGDLGPGEGLITQPAQSDASRMFDEWLKAGVKTGLINPYDPYNDLEGQRAFQLLSLEKTMRDTENARADSILTQNQLAGYQREQALAAFHNTYLADVSGFLAYNVGPQVNEIIAQAQQNPSFDKVGALESLRTELSTVKRQQIDQLRQSHAQFAASGNPVDETVARQQVEAIESMYEDLENATDINQIDQILKRRLQMTRDGLELGVLGTDFGARLFQLDKVAPGAFREGIKYLPRIMDMMSDPTKLDQLFKLYPESKVVFDALKMIGPMSGELFSQRLYDHAVSGTRTGDPATDHMIDDIAAMIAMDGYQPGADATPGNVHEKAAYQLIEAGVTVDSMRHFTTPGSIPLVRENPELQKGIYNTVVNYTTPGTIDMYLSEEVWGRNNELVVYVADPKTQTLAVRPLGNDDVPSDMRSIVFNNPYSSPVSRRIGGEEIPIVAANERINKLNDMADAVRMHWHLFEGTSEYKTPDEYIKAMIVDPAVASNQHNRYNQVREEYGVRIGGDIITPDFSSEEAGSGEMYEVEVGNRSYVVKFTGRDSRGNPVLVDIATGKPIKYKPSMLYEAEIN